MNRFVVSLPILVLTAGPVAARIITDARDVTDGSAYCMVVTTLGAGAFSMPSPSNPVNPRQAAQYRLDGGELAAAATNYQAYVSGFTGFITQIYWDIGGPDPYCYGYRQLFNVRYTP